ncbi:MAG: sigma-54-dependent Fis family transcriptional regulator [Nitrospirae bacterium]|nr:sigma-54-dependent Fis family transcriptional regulator [Nitrospirota bacterium]
METIFIIDDEEDVCRMLGKFLTQEGYRAAWTTAADSALPLIQRESPSCVLLDRHLGDSDGMTVLSQIREWDSRLPVIMLTGYPTVETAVQAMKKGAFHYATKPFNREEMTVLIAMAIEQRRLHRQIEGLQARLGEVGDLEASMGASEKTQQVIRLARSVAATKVNVLILGESGTGKELVARAIHRLSNGHEGSFIPVDCAAIPETLIESELFGYEKGAFTGATSTVKGKCELADGGTLFLDEIGNIPGPVQSKLLRFLESHEIERVGGRRTIRTSVRVIAATNADLARASRENLFRLDLFYRLNEFMIHLPPLRERRDDIPFLCHRFLLQMGPEMGKEVSKIAPEALERLHRYSFPGNVRELRNIMKRAMVMAEGCVELVDLPPEVRNPGKSDLAPEIRLPISHDLPFTEVARKASEQVERQLILEALQKTKGHQGKAADLLGITRRTLYNKIKELGIRSGFSGA